MYSQNDEEQIILKHFGAPFVGRVLDIGANDGKTLSNSLACIERGWGAVLVEPSREAFKRLLALHKDNPNVECHNVAISNEVGVLEFFESGSHLKTGDHALLSSLKKEEVERWKGTDNEFTETIAEAITFEMLLKRSKRKSFDLITIDAEGMDFEILSQMNLKKLGCRMLIVESNSIEDNKYINYCLGHGYRLLNKNYQNLTFVLR